jgi:hypothetical protein
MPRPPEEATPRPVRHVDLDSAITNSPPLGAQAVPSAPHELHRATAIPPAAEPNAAPGATADQASPDSPRTTDTTDIADGDPGPREMTTLPGLDSGKEPATIRQSASTSDAAPANRPGASRPVSRLAALQLEDEARVTAARAATRLRGDLPARTTDDRRAAPDPDLDAGVTEPSLPILAVGDEHRVDLPLRAAPPSSAPPRRKPGWASGLAARIDAAIDSDESNLETPVVAPTGAELRALLGQPDPTRRQPVDEIAMLQRRAAEFQDGGPPRRPPHPTTEVDPDDIEAAIELAPPARRPTNAHAIGVAKPKKSE